MESKPRVPRNPGRNCSPVGLEMKGRPLPPCAEPRAAMFQDSETVVQPQP